MTHRVIVLYQVQKDRFVTNEQKLSQHYMEKYFLGTKSLLRSLELIAIILDDFSLR